MDKKKKVIFSTLLLLVNVLASTALSYSQEISKIQFCDRKYEYAPGKDSITLYFNVLDEYGDRIKNLTLNELKRSLSLNEDNVQIPNDARTFSIVSSGQRIPQEYTFSVLVDLSIPQSGKEQIYSAIEQLIYSAHDGSVFISFFGDDVSSSVVATRENYGALKEHFALTTENKFFYSALMAKLLEFGSPAQDSVQIKYQQNYEKNGTISLRALQNKEKNILIVFTEGSKRPSDEELMFFDIVNYQRNTSHLVPNVMALYYTEEGTDITIEDTFKGICEPKDSSMNVIEGRRGKYLPSNNMQAVLQNFAQVVNDAMYDYSFSYQVSRNSSYSRIVSYTAFWGGNAIGEGKYSIGTAEAPWPIRVEEASDVAVKVLYAIIITLITIFIFLLITKALVPFVRSKSFAMKYYRRYEAEENISRRICHYCKQDIQPGQMVVVKCRHIMHLHCWKQNGYKCAEYGQNCKTGIQSHLDWKSFFSMASLKESYQVISGIIAGFVSWIVYEIIGSHAFDGLSGLLINGFFEDESIPAFLHQDCLNKASAFLAIGLFLGFFLSLIFRYNDEFKKKTFTIWLKLLGLSLLTSFIGMIAFALGANILCLILSAINTSYIPWYCSLPAYLLFSISVSLSLTIKSTIPVKSAMIGGLLSSLIGFIVLYCSSRFASTSGWVNMLLDFIIYGGGLGASLVTVRMLAEKYFLVIKNGVRAGQRIPIHKWMNSTGGANKVSIGMTGECEIQMNWEKSNKVAKEHAQLFIDYDKQLPMLKPMANILYNNRADLAVSRPVPLSNGDTFKIGDTIFQYEENE